MITLFNLRPRALNVGNDVIAIGMRNLLAEAFGEVVNVISLPATSKYEAHAKAGLDAATIYEINQYGHGVIVGGGNLYENGELQLDINALESLEAPLMLFSLSMGRIYGRLNRLVRRTNAMPDDKVKKLNNKALISFARCKATHDYLHGLGLKEARLGGCPTLYVAEIANRLPPVPEANQNRVLISIRTPNLMSIPLEARSHVRNDILGIIDLLERRGIGKPALLCHDYRDIEFAASFKGVDYFYLDDPMTFLALLKSAKLNVSYRLHSALPCHSFGTPCITVSYDERALSLLDTTGFGGWDINMVTSKSVVGDVADRLDRLHELDGIKQKAMPIWASQRKEMSDGFVTFAEEVRRYRDMGA